VESIQDTLIPYHNSIGCENKVVKTMIQHAKSFE